MNRITHAEAVRLRRTPGATVALFLTDRCPVGCAHCSVSSTPDGGTISDWPLFTEVVAGLVDLPALTAVAITGGEPFSEPRGLRYAVAQLADAGKAVVVFTSGSWARGRIASWVPRVLARTATVYLSTDSFHAAGLAGQRAPADPLGAAFTAAAVAVQAAGCHLVIQVLDEPGLAVAARARYPDADIAVIAPLPVGRGARVLPPGTAYPPSSFGACTLLDAPTVRYDGRILACCSEAVIAGHGPAGLRRTIGRQTELAGALDQLRSDPVTRLMARYGPRALGGGATRPYRSICEPCWAAHERFATDPRAAAALTLLAGPA